MTLPAGTKLGPYEVQSAVGAGGMGEVYRARDTRLGREVALKVLPESFARDTERLRRFEQEARTVAALNHPNILAVHDIGENQGAPYMVCELLEGETLREKMKAGALGQRRALEYAAQIAEGLAAAHEQGIVHRDLKPENIFVTRDGRVKVLDFGLAKLKPLGVAATAGQGWGGANNGDGETVGGATQTSPGVVLGTAGYMSPEQVRGKEVDGRTDIFAFGAILYEMVSGERAFRGESSVETMNAILKEDPPELSPEKLKVSPGLERVVRRCLEKEPARRFQSARDVGFALEAISGTSTSTAHAAVAGVSSNAGRRYAGMAAVLVAIAVAAFLAGSRMTAPAPRDNQFKLLTFKPQIIFRARFAPDGQTVVFSSALHGVTPEIFTLSPEYPEPRPTGLRDTQLLAVSSKGELAVLSHAEYAAHRVFVGTLGRVGLGGTAPRDVLDGVYEADWTPDGSDLAVTRVVGGKFRLEYPIGHVLAETSGYFSDLRFSPQGDRIAFFEHGLRFDDRGLVAVVDLAGNIKRLTEEFWGEEGLAWSADGKEILFSAGLGSYSSFPVRAVTLGGKMRVAQQSAGGLWIDDVGRGGKWVLTAQEQWREMMVMAPGAKAEQDMSFLDLSYPAALSTDGKLLLFTEENGALGPYYSVCIRKTDGSAPVRLGDGAALDLSPDGTQALAWIPTSPNKLVSYPTGAGQMRQLGTGKVSTIEGASWFPDGKRVLLCGSEPGHNSRCYVLDGNGGEPRAITPENVGSALPSPDGEQVLARPGDGAYSLYPLNGGTVRAVPLQKDDFVIGWTLDRKGVIVRRQTPLITRTTGATPPSTAMRSQPGVALERVDLDSGRRSLLRRLEPADTSGLVGIQIVTPANDAKWYAYSERRQKSALYVMDRK